MNQEGGTGTGQRRTGYRYRNSNTTKKPSFKIKTTNLEDGIFTQGRPYDAVKYEDSIKTVINYVKQEYYTGVYPGQAIRELKVTDLALPIKPTKDNNLSETDFDTDVFYWKENAKYVFGRRHNI